MADRFIAMFDILGFRHLIETKSLRVVIRRAKRFVAMAQDAVDLPSQRAGKRLSVIVFQDTIIVTTAAATVTDLRAIVQYSCGLIGFGFAEGFMLRGAVVRGRVYVDDRMVIGPGVVLAHQMEQSQDWMGCWLHDECLADVEPSVVREFASNLIVRYHVPLKAGTRRELWALNWTIPFHAIGANSLKRAWNREWLPACEDGKVTWDIRRKLEQTDRFLRELFRLGQLA